MKEETAQELVKEIKKLNGTVYKLFIMFLNKKMG